MVRQGREPGERVPHLGVRRFHHPSAAEREDGVAGKQRSVGREPIGDMVGAMAGRLPDVHRKLPHPHGVALADISVGHGHLATRLFGRDHTAAGAPLQGLDRLHVVAGS